MINKLGAAYLLGLMLAVNGVAMAAGNSNGPELNADETPEWKEAQIPPPPSFDLKNLIALEVSPASSLVYGVDPASIQISEADGVVRYVMVATSASGATNVMYEGIRCASGEVKTYARYSADGRWSMVASPEWRSMYNYMPSRHAFKFAKAAACNNSATTLTVRDMVARLKNPNAGLGN